MAAIIFALVFIGLIVIVTSLDFEPALLLTLDLDFATTPREDRRNTMNAITNGTGPNANLVKALLKSRNYFYNLKLIANTLFPSSTTLNSVIARPRSCNPQVATGGSQEQVL